jgi:hypothetical protein
LESINSNDSNNIQKKGKIVYFQWENLFLIHHQIILLLKMMKVKTQIDSFLVI